MGCLIHHHGVMKGESMGDKSRVACVCRAFVILGSCDHRNAAERLGAREGGREGRGGSAARHQSIDVHRIGSPVRADSKLLARGIGLIGWSSRAWLAMRA